jgi:DNA helicase-2/ATP-dependent DNA helicase PcrA
LLLREDAEGNILEAKVIDFKSMDYPERNRNPFFWINLSLQVQLYAHAANIVLGESAKTGAVHLLKEQNGQENPNRIDVPISDEAINAAIGNIQWAVEKILTREFPMRPSRSKCEGCDFNKICAKVREEFSNDQSPAEIHIPTVNGVNSIAVRCFSDVEGNI